MNNIYLCPTWFKVFFKEQSNITLFFSIHYLTYNHTFFELKITETSYSISTIWPLTIQIMYSRNKFQVKGVFLTDECLYISLLYILSQIEKSCFFFIRDQHLKSVTNSIHRRRRRRRKKIKTKWNQTYKTTVNNNKQANNNIWKKKRKKNQKTKPNKINYISQINEILSQDIHYIEMYFCNVPFVFFFNYFFHTWKSSNRIVENITKITVMNNSNRFLITETK
jgi:hypothetical protein